MSDAVIDRFIGLGALVVGLSVIFFTIRLPLDPKSSLPLIRKVFGFVVAAALILYGLFSLVVG